MRGFDDTSNPLYLALSADVLGVLGISNPVTLDQSQTEATDYGVLTVVSGQRYFVPWAKVLAMKQAVPSSPVPTVPTAVPAVPPVVSGG